MEGFYSRYSRLQSRFCRGLADQDLDLIAQVDKCRLYSIAIHVNKLLQIDTKSGQYSFTDFLHIFFIKDFIYPFPVAFLVLAVEWDIQPIK